MRDYLEKPVLFGPEGSLIGMLATPAEGQAEPVACLLMNMGANHRIGPRRINVKIARAMAAHGIASIRIDLSGMGDSRPTSGSAHYRTQAVLDLQAAMDCIEKELGIRRFVAVGLCSGAENVMASAVADARVAGVLMFDGFAFPGRRSQLEKTLRRALADLSVATLAAKVMGKLRRFMPARAAPGSQAAYVDGASSEIFRPESPTEKLAYFSRSMSQLAERKVSALLLYSGTLHVTDRGRDQLGPLAQEPFMRQFEYRFIPEIDHSLLSPESQQTFLSLACEWALRVIREGASQPRERRVAQTKPSPVVMAEAPGYGAQNAEFTQV
ncbi:alpha/beta fold hydrolase [Variovorax ureilyticus]|uniref:alpha/beta fold hydrolase n=1 Tax=Variovorax ureilyticus TaxID=1836198 RepID=UPI003D67186F